MSINIFFWIFVKHSHDMLFFKLIHNTEINSSRQFLSYRFFQEDFVIGEMVRTEKTSQSPDDDFKELSVHVLSQGHIPRHPIPTELELCKEQVNTNKGSCSLSALHKTSGTEEK